MTWGKQTVKKRIFLSNALMVLVTVVLFLTINVFVMKAGSESIEHEFKDSLEKAGDEGGFEGVMEGFAVYRKEFLLLLLADGILCMTALAVVSHFFTKRLVNHIMEPLDALADGAERIRDNDLTRDIEYAGDMEFENVCHAFNAMRRSILAEQEKNKKYERARTDMIAGISHDLRTPLTAVRGTIKGLLDGVASTPERQKKFLETAWRRTGDMALLLNQLFYLSRLETGNMLFAFKTIELSAFLQNYADAKQGLLEHGQAELLADAKGMTVKVCVDPEQLVRIFDNLLENSRKYAEKTPLKMKLSLRRSKGGVTVCFSDNGVGVAEEKLPYLFDEFYRGDESRNRKEGNGLGLYIVKYLVGAMGGSVRAENADGLAVFMEFPVKGEGVEETCQRKDGC